MAPRVFLGEHDSSPEPHITVAPDMISTARAFTRALHFGVEITSSPLMCSRATVGSRSRNEASLLAVVNSVAGRGWWNVASGA